MQQLSDEDIERIADALAARQNTQTRAEDLGLSAEDALYIRLQRRKAEALRGMRGRVFEKILGGMGLVGVAFFLNWFGQAIVETLKALAGKVP